MAYVLLLESNTLLAAAYTQALQQAGHVVVAVTGAQAAIRAADVHTPDMVIMELQLPRHNGIEFLHEFRSYPEWRCVPVVINTVLPPAKLDGLQANLRGSLGVSVVLYKPTTTLADLLRVVREQAVAV